MKIFVHATAPHQIRYADMLASGMAAHGDTVTRDVRAADTADLIAFWGHRQRGLIDACRRSGRRYLVMERAYLGDRHEWVSLGYDGLNGYADFCHHPGLPDRSARWADSLRPWKRGRSGYALIAGQVPGDMSLRGIDVHDWATRTVREASQIYDRVIYRPHPVAAARGASRKILGAESSTRPLDDDLAGAAIVVTYTSNLSVDAVMRGIPTVTTDRGSMAWDVTSHHVLHPTVRPDRQAWLQRLAYCQWLPHEVADGTAWAHLRPHAVRPTRS